MSTYDAFATLPLVVEGYELERLEQPVSSDFTRVTTVIHLHGGGEEGVGEDVTYAADLHPPPRDLPVTGERTLDGFGALLDRLELFAEPPRMAAFAHYRRWAFESAALDLALRQAGRTIADALGREPQPVRFVVSKRIDSIDVLRRLLERYPGTRLKLDPTSDWTEEQIEAIAATGAVDVVDLKGAYKGTSVDQPPDPVLYDRVARAFRDAWIEDPALTSETEAVLAPHRERITWDAPIHSVADVEALSFAPRTLNVKPSRFGQLRELCAFYDYCAERGIALYGGGQFELGPGRGQIQVLASLFHPDGSNDVAPGGYNETQLPDGLDVSPLEPALAPTGFLRRPR